MNQRNQSPRIHLVWRISQVDITHQASAAKIFSTVLLHSVWLNAFTVIFVGCVKDSCHRHKTINTVFMCQYMSGVAVSVQENNTLQLQWKRSQTTPFSETSSNTWANVCLLVYNTADVSQIIIYKIVIVYDLECVSLLQQQERSCLKLPEHFQKRRSGESPKGSCSWSTIRILCFTLVTYLAV